MTLPAPNLDDRGFQDLVDEAKRFVQLRNPEWTDHNVSDPGVTLIETFAFLVDQLIYRLNRVPDLHYVKFLELLGERMLAPSAARTSLEFGLSIAQPQDVVIPRGSLVSTVRIGEGLPTTFSTTEDLTIASVSVSEILTKHVDGGFESVEEARNRRVEFPAFSPEPKVGDGLYIGLSQPAPQNFVRLVYGQDDEVEGIGIDPLNPPLAYSAWNGSEWVHCPVISDESAGLNKEDPVVIFIPSHARSTLGGVPAAWIRVEIVPTVGDQPAYIKTPEIYGVEAEAIGGVVGAAHCEPVENEIIGPCSGTPGDRLTLSQYPLVAGQQDLVIEVSGSQGWQTWRRVATFADSEPTDRHFTVDEVTGELRFGPAIRNADGSVRLYGATPEVGAMVRIPRYLIGGGNHGNVDANTLTVMESDIPFVQTVTNPRAAAGGIDAETVENVKERAAISVRTQMRAVTPRDYELLTRQAAPSMARVSCVDATSLGKPGHVLVQVVPSVAEDVSDFALLQPRPEELELITSYLDARRPVGAIVHVEPPRYIGVGVAVRFALEPGASKVRVSDEMDLAIRRFVHPTLGGYDGRGWPFGRALLLGDIHAVLQRTPGVQYIDVVRLAQIDIVTGLRGEPSDRVQPGPRDLLFCVGNEIEVIA